MKPNHFLVLALSLCMFSAPAFSETFLVLMEETRNGEAYPQPHFAREGLLAALFEHGHIIFDNGGRPPGIDWKRPNFEGPLALARLGGAHFLIASRIRTELVEREDEAPQIESLAQYYLLDVNRSLLVGRGELMVDNFGREEELPFDKLLYNLGEQMAEELIRLWQIRLESAAPS